MRIVLRILATLACVSITLLNATDVGAEHNRKSANPVVDAIKMVREGRKTFRYDTFGNEDFWGGALGLHSAIAGSANGGIGPGVSPATALAVGLKVDSSALPKDVKKALARGEVDLNDPATTLTLLALDAVVGVQGRFDDSGAIRSIGITCALCHSTVDDSFAPGIGRRLDGWAARDLNVGAIVALSESVAPFAQLLGVDEATVRAVLNSWGPGKFDAALFLDGQAFTPGGNTAATLIPPAFGLAGVNLHTWSGWGSVTHWNAFVAVLEMQGKGTFYDPRLKDAGKFPVAAANGFDNVRNDPDLVTPKLAALQFYQLALKAPAPPKGSFDRKAAQRGKKLFAADGQAGCAYCHVPPIFTEPGWNVHTPEEIGIDGFQANRGPEDRYRTSPLKGLWSHAKGGFYHDGRFATLYDVVNHYNDFQGLGLNKGQKRDLVEYLKSL
ncbi:MAG: hypothetical protein KJO31_09530 [Gammaproteobacteria bacterium]|nr:hypothetical protein [Gammaproteobacteria bacterium]